MAFGRVLPRAVIALVLLAVPASCSEEQARETQDVPDAATPPVPLSPAVEDASVDAPEDSPRLEVSCAVTPCVRDLSASWSESFCALLDDGRVSCWGRNASGELGRDGGTWSATAAPVDGIAGAVALDRTCAVVDGGSVSCWGPAVAPSNGEGSLPAVRSIRMGDGLGCAVLTDGKVTCWGKNGLDGVLAYADAGPDEDVPPTTIPLDGPVDEIAIAHGTILNPGCPWCPPINAHAIIARRASGEVVSWGLSPLIGRATEQKPDPRPSRIAVDRADHVFGGYGGCVLAQGSLRCWGDGRDDSGGDLRPLPVALVPRAVHVALGDFGDGHFGRGCAVTPKGAVYCWGRNDYGQAGDGTQVFRDLPVMVSNLSEPIVRVEATAGTTCALSVSGRVYCWGDDGFGQRGQKTPFTTDPSPLPVEFP
ncbi:BNR repeat domain protein [Labilithrix luteola]|uniref:BNR repeat domain protein n=1 Tax=Labilithrix luteola TaxID=1391654 RepID=A0A0K1Q4E4_9BACT|nr:hypothetical protein [Labilithrix luteola]AKV00245.1 BNR repeat domain protein [Labilithrix luteola]